jgi:adenylosuccinate lyase
MHKRYTSEQIKDIWSDDSKYQLWFDIELAVCEAQAKLGNISDEAVKDIEKYRWSCVGTTNFVDQIEELEQTTKHDVLAFLTHCSNIIGPSANFIHLGMTSSDLLDTCTAIQIHKSVSIILKDLKSLMRNLRIKATEHKNTICIGRSHGIHAEPTTFGLKLLGHYSSFNRCYRRLINLINDICRIKCSGAVGTYSSIDPKVENYLVDKFGILSEDISTQVVPRDRHALLMSLLGIIGGCIENLAVEIRHLQRTEVGEVLEQFTQGQKGSSAMPHKKNPIQTENLTGLARLIKSAVAPSLDNIALWHERDISHSSVERVLLPDTFSYVSFALQRLAKVVKHMVVDKNRMEHNLEMTGGAIYSQQVLMYLINERGISREQAYEQVQYAAFNNDDTFKNNLLKYEVLTEDEIKEIFNVNYYTKNIDYIFTETISQMKIVEYDR